MSCVQFKFFPFSSLRSQLFQQQCSDVGHLQLPLTLFSGYTRATQFFETVGLIAAIASIVLLLLGVCVATCRDRRILPILSGICSIAAGW